MKYSIIPGTDIEVSKICLGTMTFGSPVEEKEAIGLVKYAYDKGINFIDTANMYEGYNRYAGSHGGVAEEIIGKAVAGQRDKYVIATKLGMKVGDAPEDENTSPKAIEVQLDRSLKRLATDYVDIYYLHRFDPVTAPEDIVRAIDKALKAGKIRSWGVSNYTADQFAALIAAAKSEGVKMPSMCQPAMSLLNTGAIADMLPLCAKEGVGVIPYQVLQGGILTGKYRRGQAAPAGSRAAEKPEWMKPMTDEVYDIIEATDKAAKEAGKTMTQYVLSWALAQQAVISTLIGVKREAQIDEAAGAVD